MQEAGACALVLGQDVVGNDAALSAVLTRMMRADYMWAEVGYVPASYAKTGTAIEGEVRGKRLPVAVAEMPFNPTTYKR